MKKYNRVMLGQGSKYAKMCRENGYIGANFDINEDLSDSLYDKFPRRSFLFVGPFKDGSQKALRG